MAAYCTVQNVRDRLPSVLSDELLTAQVQACIDEAESIIDSRLSGAFTVPFTTVPDLVKTIAVLLASSRCIEDAHMGDGTSEEHPLAMKRKARAEKLLTGIIEGEYSIGDIAPPVMLTDMDIPSIMILDLYKEPTLEELEALKWQA